MHLAAIKSYTSGESHHSTPTPIEMNRNSFLHFRQHRLGRLNRETLGLQSSGILIVYITIYTMVLNRVRSPTNMYTLSYSHFLLLSSL